MPLLDPYFSCRVGFGVFEAGVFCPGLLYRSDNPIVMVSFSPDDLFLISAAVDNEIRQYTAVDGRLNLVLDTPKTGRLDNYTRAYYMNGGWFGPWH